MEFFGRTSELAALSTLRQRSQRHGQMTVVTGRRRVGKTRLLLESLRDQDYLYFFVSRTEERLLCAQYAEQIRNTLGVTVFGTPERFSEIFKLILEVARERPINLIIDEFQDFLRINPAVYGDMQQLWDRYREEVRLNLLLCGSVQSLMERLFLDSKEPLYGRANAKLHLLPLRITDLRDAFFAQRNDLTASDFLTLYAVTGGVPYYVEQFFDSGQLNHHEILTEVLAPHSLFLEEGRFLLIQEFGKEYGTYFSILSLVAAAKTTRGAIESVLQKPIGGHITRLQDTYRILRRRRPIFGKPNTTNVRYYLEDEFLRFWFRFIYRYTATIEQRNFTRLRQEIERDFATFTGLTLERMIRQLLIESDRYSEVGHFWDRSNRTEIDVVAYDAVDKHALVGEVKKQKKKVSIPALKTKAETLRPFLKNYRLEFRAFSLDDLTPRS